MGVEDMGVQHLDNVLEACDKELYEKLYRSQPSPPLMAKPESESPFRFLDLPKELRLMVYEFLPIKTTHYDIQDLACVRYQTGDKTYTWSAPSRYWSTSINLVIKPLPASILATCKPIYEEAQPIHAKKLDDIFARPARLILDTHCSDLTEIQEFFPLLIQTIVNGKLLKGSSRRAEEMVEKNMKAICYFVDDKPSNPAAKRPSRTFELAITGPKEMTTLCYTQLAGMIIQLMHGGCAGTLRTLTGGDAEEESSMMRVNSSNGIFFVSNVYEPYGVWKNGGVVEKEEWACEWAEGFRY
jgi:hypothetical protein